MESKKKQLELQLKPVIKILIYAKDCYRYCRYFSNLATLEEILYFQNSPHLQFFSLMLWRSAILELAKLLLESESHKYNLHRLLNKFYREGHYGDFRLSKDLIDGRKTKIASNAVAIENLQILRDKVVAHTDHPKDYTPHEIDFDKFKELIDISEEIFKSIYLFGLQIDFDLRSPFFESSEVNIVQDLVFAHRHQLGKI
jgi:hypothetical protein